MPTAGTFAVVKYRERISVPWLWWVIGLAMVASMAVAVYAYVDAWIALLFALFSVAAVVVGLIGFTLNISVSDDELVVGRYRLEREYIADAKPFEGGEATRILGPGADRRNFLVTRPFVKDVVRVDLDDPEDPHPSWLISTKRPKELAAAVVAMNEGEPQ